MIEKVDWIRLGPRTILNRGDKCRVKNERGVHKFLAHAHNPETGDEWCDVIRPGKGGVRSFPVDLIRRAKR